MSNTISMWLGIAFLALVIIAVLLQAWLWGPKFWDEEAKKTRAPKGWLRVHAAAGYTYAIIYFVMMWYMLPRLWEYQYELPARTVIHAVLAIAIGVLLITKICILLFFRHFEEAMPKFGFGLLFCTVAMITLSVPYALRAHDLQGRTTDPDNIERVKTLLAEVDMGEGTDKAALTTEKGFEHGREVLVRKCIVCHDMRTILAKPRTASGWQSINLRMLEKPAVFGEPLDPADIPYVTAYLVAITPDIQESAKLKREAVREEAERTDRMVEVAHEAETTSDAPVDKAAGEALLAKKCIDCHELDEVEKLGGNDVAGWRSEIAAMVEEGAELTNEEAELLARYLAVKYPPTAKPEVAAKVEPDEPEPEEPEPAPGEDDDGDEAMPTEATPTEATPTEATPTEATPTEATPTEATPTEAPKPKAKPKPKKPKADKKAGKEIYMAKCKTCHGDDGKGDTAFGRKLGLPPLTDSGRSSSKIRAIIANGVPGTKMKGYSGQLSDTDLDNVAAFVKAL